MQRRSPRSTILLVAGAILVGTLGVVAGRPYVSRVQAVAQPTATVVPPSVRAMARPTVRPERTVHAPLSQLAAASPAGQVSPSQVEIQGGPDAYSYVVNGQPQVIRGMGLNTQYTRLYLPDDRAARLESDFSMLQAMGVNTVLGWDPAELDDVLMDTAARHGIGVVMPFDLDPAADYADPSVRADLDARIRQTVARYKDHPALRMWGLGNEVLFAMVEPDWAQHPNAGKVSQARAFAAWLVEEADAIHSLDPSHPVTYRMSEDAYLSWILDALRQRGGGPRPWFAIGVNCYSDHLAEIIDRWPARSGGLPMWVSEFAPGRDAPDARPAGFQEMWRYIRALPGRVLGGAVYAWTRNGPEEIDLIMGLTDDGQPAQGDSIAALTQLFQTDTTGQ